MWILKKNGINERICKTEIESPTQKAHLGLPRGKGKEGLIGIFGLTCTYCCIYSGKLKRTFYNSMGNATQGSIMTYMGIEFKNKWIYVYA